MARMVSQKSATRNWCFRWLTILLGFLLFGGNLLVAYGHLLRRHFIMAAFHVVAAMFCVLLLSYLPQVSRPSSDSRRAAEKRE